MPSLLRASTVYGLGLVVNRALDFALLPLYTNVFSPGEYGAVALTLTLLGFGHVVYASGFGPAFLRYAALHNETNRRRAFLGATLVVTAMAAVFSSCLIAFAPTTARLFGLSAHPGLIPLTAGILFFDALTLLPYTMLRTDGRASRFVVCTFVTTIVRVALTAYLILFAHGGIEAIFIAMLASSALNAVVVTMSVRRNVTLRIRPSFPGELLRFGLPFVPAGLAAVAMELIDRMIMNQLMDVTAVGVYSAGYKVAAGMRLVVKAFEYAWIPFLLERRDAARRVTGRAVAGFLGVAGVLWAVFLVFGEEITGIRLFGRMLIGPAYRAGVAVVPAVMFAYILSGVAEGLMAGVYLRGRSGIFPLATVFAAGVNVGANYLLIPVFGMMGAAYATILAYAALVGVLIKGRK